MVRQVAGIALEDGLEFDPTGATAEAIRDEEDYSGVRVTLGGRLSRAAVRLHVDVNVGDPIWPEPQQVSLPRLLGGALLVCGYPLEMILAEKLVTVIARGTANTRWRDFVDIYSLVRKHTIAIAMLRPRWSAWRGIDTLSWYRCVLHLPDMRNSLSQDGWRG